MADKREIDHALMGIPSMRAIKSFVAAAKYKSFTDAAEALCVTQSAVSKQVRELETYLGTELFVRSGRSVSLTTDGTMYHDAAQLSFMNILQATERLRRKSPDREVLTVCCSPAFSTLWLQPRLSKFLDDNLDIEVTVLAALNFMTMEAGVLPDVNIGKVAVMRDGYEGTRLFDDVVYPVCTPKFLERCDPIATPEDLRDKNLLDLNAYGRSQVSEHIDWKVWLALHNVDINARSIHVRRPYCSNDYNSVVHMALEHQGFALGWHHLVSRWIESGELVRPIPHEVTLKNRSHYLAVRKTSAESEATKRFCEWILSEIVPLKN